MRYCNAFVFLPGKGFVRGGFDVEDGRFAAVFTDERDGEVDLCGACVIPGLVDIHTHGAMGADFSDGDAEGLRRMAAHLAGRGVTSFAPTSMTLPYETLEAAFATAAELYDNRPEGCARVMGVHMEGPFFSEKKKGAQNGAYLKEPDFEGFRKLYEGCGGLVRIVDLAPELEGAAAFTEKAKALCTVSVAHTDASYEEAKAVFEAGASHLTHTFNAMPGIRHRKPGPIGAASERGDVAAELICDGLHVHPSAVRMAFRLFPGRICLISDSLRCCGMPDGDRRRGQRPVRGYAQRRCLRDPEGGGDPRRDDPPRAGDRTRERDRLDRNRKARGLRRLRRRSCSARGLHRRRKSISSTRQARRQSLAETIGRAGGERREGAESPLSSYNRAQTGTIRKVPVCAPSSCRYFVGSLTRNGRAMPGRSLFFFQTLSMNSRMKYSAAPSGVICRGTRLSCT